MERPYVEKDNEHIYYPRKRKGKILGALIFIFCLVLPVFGVTFGSVFEIAALTGVGGFFIFAVIGAVIAIWLYRVLDFDIESISVYQTALRICFKDGSERSYPLENYAGYTSEYASAKTTYKVCMLWFSEGYEKVGVEIGCLSEEQRQSLVGEIDTFARIARCDRAVRTQAARPQQPKPAVSAHNAPRTHAPEYQYKKTDPRAYRGFMQSNAAKITLNDRLHLTKMLKESRLIEAVKLIQKITGLGLAEARDLAVEHSDLIIVGPQLEKTAAAPSGGDYAARKADKAAYREYMKTKAELIDWQKRSQARTLIEQGKTIEAIKLVRVEAGLGLAEARDLVCDHGDLL